MSIVQLNNNELSWQWQHFSVDKKERRLIFRQITKVIYAEKETADLREIKEIIRTK